MVMEGDLVEEFLLDCRLRSLSPATIEWYRDRLSRALSSINGQGVSRLEDIEARHIRAFVAECLVRELSVRTINGYLRTLNVFFNYMVSEEVLEKSPAERVRKLKEPQFRPPILTAAEITRLLAAFPRTFHGLRNRLITQLLVDTGLRVGEVVGIKLGDMDGQRLLVRGKGQKERIVFFGTQVGKVMRRYLRRRKQWLGGKPCEWLFPSRGTRPLTRSGVYQALQRAADKAGLGEKRVSPHVLRYSFVRFMVLSGCDPFTIQELLGHRTMEMTRRYSRLLEEDLREKHARHSPMDEMAP